MALGDTQTTGNPTEQDAMEFCQPYSLMGLQAKSLGMSGIRGQRLPNLTNLTAREPMGALIAAPSGPVEACSQELVEAFSSRPADPWFGAQALFGKEFLFGKGRCLGTQATVT